MRDVIRKAMGTSLGMFTRLGSSPLLERLGLRDATVEAVYRGTKASVAAAQAARPRPG